MTTYEAYDEGLPCKNPHCASHGKPHPNCKCYGGMAEGGEVNRFCDGDNPHEKECEYYADGGDVIQKHDDPESSASAFLTHGGLHSLIDMGKQDILKYNQSVKRGHKQVDAKIGQLFDGNESKSMDYDKAHKSINDWIDKGGITQDIQQGMYDQNSPQMFAEGGQVKEKSGILDSNPIADAYPAQNMILQTAKGRMSNYLTGLKPQKHAPKLAFDDEPDTREQEKSYKRAVKIAADPMRILDKVKKGTIEQEHVKHFKSLYPELDNAIQKKLTEKIVESQMKGEKPSYKVRQGMSMLMGVPLSGEMSPQNMMAAQATFQGKQPQQPQAAPKGNTAALKKTDDSFMTSEQSRVARSQKQ